MLKTTLIALAFSTAGAGVMFVFAGRTVHSSPFQMDIPYLSAVKTTVDPANVWSWHHDFVGSSQTQIVDVLVDVDGNNVMDTEHPWLRVVVTDLELVAPQYDSGVVWILDGTGRRYAVGTRSQSSPVCHVSLTTPITLPVGSPLRVQLEGGYYGPFSVNLVGRVVNL